MTTPAPAPESSTALAIPMDKIRAIENIANTYGLAAAANMGQMETTLTLARGVELLEEALTPEVMRPIMRLQGTRLGFLTDKQGGYGEDIVKRCVIEAFLRGVRPVMNEMNIIASGFYATKEAFTRLLKEFPGLTDLRIDMGIPLADKNPKTAVVECTASWRLNGAADSLTARIPIRVNEGMLPDAILGKAERKLKARVYWRLTGSESNVPEGEVEMRNVTPASAGSSGLDAFAAGGPVVDIPSQEVPWKPEDEVQAHPPDPTPAAPPPPAPAAPRPAAPPPPAATAPEFLPPEKWEGLKRFAKSAKVSETELQGIVASITGQPFDPDRIPGTLQEAEVLRRIKEYAASRDKK